MHTMRIRRGGTVAVALLLAVVLAVPRTAYAQAEYVQVAPSVAQFMGWTASGTAVWATASGVQTGISGAGALTAGGIGVATGTAAVAAGTGVLIGWGTVHSGLWDWADCKLTGDALGCDPVPGTEVSGGLVEANAWPGTSYVIGLNAPDRCDSFGEPAWCFSGNYEIKQEAIDAAIAAGYSGTDATTWYWGCRDPAAPEVGWYVIHRNTSTPSLIGGSYFVCDPHNTNANMDVTTAELAIVPLGEWMAGDFQAGWVQSEGSYEEDRRLTTSADCWNWTTGATTTVTATSPAYAPGAEPASPRVDCPAGHMVTGASVKRTIGDDTDTTDDEQLLTFVPDVEPTTVDEYADCYGGGCELMIYKGTGVDARRCDSEDVNCLGWWDAVQGDPTTFECKWGPHVMPISDCDMFRDIDSDTYTGPDGGDQPVKVAPGSAANPAHVEDGCDAGGGSWWNPFDNIAGGVACAIQWAFVPSTESMTQLETATGAMAETVPFTYVSDITGWVGGFSDVGAGCLKFSVPINTGRVDYGAQPAFDCNGPVGSQMRTGAVRGVLTAAVWGFFVVPLAWWAWRQYAPGSQGEA